MVGSRCLLFLTALVLATALAASPAQKGEPSSAGGKADLAGDLVKLRRQTPPAAPGTPEAHAFAGKLEEIGRGYLEQGDPGRAVELLEEAYGWDERNGLVLAELTLAYVRTENFPFARFYLELAEQRAPQAPPEIYATLGEVYYALNRVEDAVLAWEQFERLRGNDPNVLRRLSRARQEVSLSRGQRFLEAGDFSIFSDAAVPPEMVEKVAERLASSYKEESTLFAARFLSSQVVVLYAGRAYFTLVSVPEWVSGVFDGKIRVAVDPEGGVTPQLEMVLSHELAHAFIRQASGGRAPGWLHEGLAQWCEGRRLVKSVFRDIFAGRRPASLSEMEGNMTRRSDRATARANYGEALGLIEYLIQHRGEGSLVCLLQDLAEGMLIEDALRKETSLNPEQLVSSWKTWAGL